MSANEPAPFPTAFWNEKRVLVTGGAGVIGTEMMALLDAAGAHVLCADLKPRPSDFPERFAYIEGDANELTAEPIKTFDPEVCVHLAATFERSTETEEFWDENFHHNIRLSHHLMTLLRRAPSLKRVVFASSYLIYDPRLYAGAAPPAVATPLHESTPMFPRNICGAAKMLHELELRYLEEFCSFTTISARIFRVYGRGSRDIVSRWVRSLIRDESAPLTVFRPEGIFDYVWAGDVAEGLLRLGASLANGFVNLGFGTGRRVSHLIRLLREHFPALTVHEADSSIPWEGHVAQMTRFAQATGWSPPTTLEEGLAQLIEHERARGGAPVDGEA